jgi:hypothetical protein
MAFDINGEFALNPSENWGCDDDTAHDVLEWVYLLGWLHIAQPQCTLSSGNKGEQDA